MLVAVGAGFNSCHEITAADCTKYAEDDKRAFNQHFRKENEEMVERKVIKETIEKNIHDRFADKVAHNKGFDKSIEG